jgi:hypothetical protein
MSMKIQMKDNPYKLPMLMYLLQKMIWNFTPDFTMRNVLNVFCRVKDSTQTSVVQKL